jgi:hypothetical protein
MITTIYTCHANTLRGQLKHSWLENQVIANDDDDIASFWKDGWVISGVDVVETMFPYYLSQTFKLADNLAEGFSPAQLIDQLGPFKEISDDLRGQVKKAIHEAYLEASNIAALAEPIRKCARDLEPELNKLRSLWKVPHSPEGEIEVRGCWEDIQEKGAALHEQLEKLPRGVILP